MVLDRKYRRNARKSRQWTKKWLLKRQELFSHVNLLKELRFHPKDWHNFFRMNESTYITLLSMVTCIVRMRWAGHVARSDEERRVHRALVGKPERKRHGET